MSAFVVHQIEALIESSDLAEGVNLMRFEAENLNNMVYNNIVTAAFANYQGSDFDLTRTVEFIGGDAGSDESIKKITISISKGGKQIADAATYIAKNVRFGTSLYDAPDSYNQASFLTIDTDTTSLERHYRLIVPYDQLEGALLINENTSSDIVIDRLYIAWSPWSWLEILRYIREVRIKKESDTSWTTLYYDWPGEKPGEEIDISDFTLVAGTAYDYQVEFSTIMNDKEEFALSFIMEDNSIKDDIWEP